MTVRRVRVGDVLTLTRRPVGVQLDKTYEEIGIRSFGRGVFHKEPVSGAQLGSKRVFWIEPGDLLLSNVFAWEGAIAVAGESERGKIGSHRFMTYVPIDGHIDTGWASWFFRSESGLELIRKASPGSAGRNRTLAIDRFEALEIPLPPIEEQRRTAAQLDQVSRLTRLAAQKQRRAQRLYSALTDSRESQLISKLHDTGVPLRSLGEVAEINPRPARLQSDNVVSFVPMSAVNASTGSVSGAEERLVHEIGPGYKQFRRGDVIFARITPCMENGKTAVYSASEYGYGSTEFHVVRPSAEVSAEYLHRIMRTRDFRRQAAERFTGTAGQQRVPADFMRNVVIPVPGRDEQCAIVAEVDELRAKSRDFTALSSRAETLERSLLPAALNANFSTPR